MATPSLLRAPEREMNRHQRGLVDTCFEEGHYEAGISILDKLRLENIRPSASHIRQLIYMSLYPPAKPDTGKGKGKDTVAFGSPSKVIPTSKQNRATLWPKPSATEAAIVLLTALSLTNTADGLLQAIPCYPLNESERGTIGNGGRLLGRGTTNSDLYDSDDSYIAKESAVITDCRDCWSMLKYGVVKRKEEHPIGRGRHAQEQDEDEEDTEWDVETNTPVGKHSWSILDWLVTLFKKDEASNENKYSNCLLSQIRPPRTESGIRSGADLPLDIVFACYKQREPRRRDLGASLMFLLINLTHCQHFSANQFLLSTITRLRTLDDDSVSTFLSDLPNDLRGLAFKLVLCDKYMLDSLRAGTQEAVAGGRGIRRPQARRARPVATNSSDAPQRNPDVIAKPLSFANQSLYPWTLPSTTRVIQIFSPEHRFSDMILLHYIIVFNLLMAFGALKLTAPEGDVDGDWTTVLYDESFPDKVATFFTRNSAPQSDGIKLQNMRDISLFMLASWKKSARTCMVDVK